MIIEERLYRRIEWLFYEVGRQAQKEQDAISQAYRSARDTSGNGISAHGDPTALAAIWLTEGQRSVHGDWIVTIVRILKHLARTNQLYARLIRLYYFYRVPVEEVCNRLGVTRETFHCMKNQIVYRTALAAYGTGLLTREGATWKTSA